MVGQRRRDTAPELALRRMLHAAGRRYFVDRRPIPQLRRAADLVFPRQRLAVFVDGCFWHGCPAHGSAPRANSDWWRRKLARTKARDAETDILLRDAGWTVVRIWEHEPTNEAASRVQAVLAAWHERLEDEEDAAAAAEALAEYERDGGVAAEDFFRAHAAETRAAYGSGSDEAVTDAGAGTATAPGAADGPTEGQ